MPPALLAVCRSLLAPFTISSERTDVALSAESPDVPRQRCPRLPVRDVPPYRVEDAGHERHDLLGRDRLPPLPRQARVGHDEPRLARRPPLHVVPRPRLVGLPAHHLREQVVYLRLGQRDLVAQVVALLVGKRLPEAPYQPVGDALRVAPAPKLRKVRA